MSKESIDYNAEEWQHFSYEDLGQTKLMSFLFLFMSAILVVLCKEYAKFYKQNEKIVSPHFFMILALSV